MQSIAEFISFNSVKLEPLVHEALSRAAFLAEAQRSPVIDAGLALQGILDCPSSKPTPAFRKISNLVGRKLGASTKSNHNGQIETLAIDPGRVGLSPAFHRSVRLTLEHLRQFGRDLLWGRDLIASVLLTEKEAGLDKQFDSLAISPSILRERWFDFIAREAPGGRSEGEWVARWHAAGVELPKSAAPGGQLVSLFNHAGTEVGIRHITGKPWAVEVDAFVLPTGPSMGFRGRLAKHLRDFLGEAPWNALASQLHSEQNRIGPLTPQTPITVQTGVLARAMGLPDFCIAATTEANAIHSLDHVETAVNMICEVSNAHRVARISLPLLGAGARLPAPDVVETIIRGLHARLRDRTSGFSNLRKIVVTTLQASDVATAHNLARRLEQTQRPRLPTPEANNPPSDVVPDDSPSSATPIDGPPPTLSSVLASVLLEAGEQTPYLEATTSERDTLAQHAFADTEAFFLTVPDRILETIEDADGWSALRGYIQTALELWQPVRERNVPWILVLCGTLALRITADEPPRARELMAKLGWSEASVAERLTAWLDSYADASPDFARLRARLQGPKSPRVPRTAMYWNDQPRHIDDQLGIRNDVEALSDVVAAARRKPPLAIGLFGDWGAGKSFFIRALKSRLGGLQDSARAAAQERLPTAYCKRIVHVEFNAWQYTDGNLWANLVCKILEGLSDELFGTRAERNEADHQKLRAQLYEKLSIVREQVAEKEEKLDALDSVRKTAEQRVEKLKTRDSNLLKKLAPVTLKSVYEGLREQPRLQKLAERLGLEHGPDSPEWLTDIREAHEAMNLVERMRRLLRRQPFLLGLAVAVFFLVGVVPWFAPQWAASVLGALNTTPTLIAGALAPLALFFERVSKFAKTAENAVGIIERAEQKSRDEQQVLRENAKIELASVTKRLVEAEKELSRIVQAESELNREVEQTKAGARLRQFIKERSASADYRQHLGIVANVRKDFEDLGALLSELSATGESEFAIERVVLYVDDLDRCPADRVVEILQAVHLLLDFELFVAVVAVDPRWLQNSLEAHYAFEFNGGSGASPQALHRSSTIWAASPRDFLEKIFQIPFTLRPMDEQGFRKLVAEVVPLPTPTQESSAVPNAHGEPPTPPSEKQHPAPPLKDHSSPPKPSVEKNLPSSATASTPTAPQGTAAANTRPSQQPPQPSPAPTDPPPVERPDPNPKTLHIESHERDTIQEFSPLVATPRTAKRLVNLYWFVRASLAQHQLEEFVGTPDHPGSYRVHLFLLGVIVTSPALAERLLQLVRSESQTPMLELLDRLKLPSAHGGSEATEAESQSWGPSCDVLAELHHRLSLPSSGRSYLEAGERVARFSFRPGRARLASRRVLLDAAGDPPHEDAPAAAANAAPL